MYCDYDDHGNMLGQSIHVIGTAMGYIWDKYVLILGLKWEEFKTNML